MIHLGDVYLAGLPHEYRRNFLKYWPAPAGSENQISSWCLAGNHDMYSGGHAYFEMLKEDERFGAQNQSAYFLLESKDWQVFGLDTAYDPRDFRGSSGELYGEQAGWVMQQRIRASGKKCLILTHHQPFSAYEPTSDRLRKQLKPLHTVGPIDAWFWGHEHLCAVYAEHKKIRFPVLLGHGGFPERRKKKRIGSPRTIYEWSVSGKWDFLLFGFAVLDFDGPVIQVKLVDENGAVQYSFSIS